jgi:hypothetical protein
MSTIILNQKRVGNFTSSEIHKLLTEGVKKNTFGKPALTYIDEKKMEREFGRSLGTEVDARATSWGDICEIRVNDLIEMKYIYQSSITKVHPEIEYWSGSADFIVPGERIAECKAYQPKKFVQYTKAILKGDINFLRNEFPAEYWQCVSNAIINGVPMAEMISYMPFEFELDDIRKLAKKLTDSGELKYRWMIKAEKQYLAYVPNESKFRSLNRFEFEIPESDKQLLTAKVIEAGKLLFT